MGCPALLGRHPRGPQYRGVQGPPPLREPPPVAQELTTTFPTQDENPKSYILALSQSSLSLHPPNTNRWNGHHIWADKTQQESAWNLTWSQTSALLEDCCLGGPTRTGPGTAPLCDDKTNHPTLDAQIAKPQLQRLHIAVKSRDLKSQSAQGNRNQIRP